MTGTGGGGRENSGMNNNNENSSYDNFKDNAKNKINAVGGDFSSRVTRMA
jgi:hypothetical protein